MVKEFSLNNKRKGSVLVFVLVLFIIISIITASVAFVFSSNLRMAKHQEENIRTHYLALSGIDVTISTLLSIAEVDINGKEKTIADLIIEKAIDRELNDVITVDGEQVLIKLNYKKDNKEFTIKSSVNTRTNFNKELSLSIIFSGYQYKKRWN